MIEASFVNKIVSKLHSKKNHIGSDLSKRQSHKHSPKVHQKKSKGLLESIGVFDKSDRKANTLSKMDKEIEKEMKANREMVVKKKEARKKKLQAKKRKLMLDKKKKKVMKRKLKEKRRKRARERLLRKFDHLDTPMQVNKLKKIYANYGINIKKLNNSDLKFLVENSKKLLQTYYNPQAMQGKLIRSSS